MTKHDFIVRTDLSLNDIVAPILNPDLRYSVNSFFVSKVDKDIASHVSVGCNNEYGEKYYFKESELLYIMSAEEYKLLQTKTRNDDGKHSAKDGNR